MGVLGAHIKKRREDLNSRFGGFSIRALAKRIGIHHSYLSKLERGENAPLTETTLVALARELGENQDFVCALGGKLPAKVSKLISGNPDLFVQFICNLENLSGVDQRPDSTSSRASQRNRDLEELVHRLRAEVLERKRLEAVVAREEEQSRMILNNLNGVAIWLLDLELKVIWMSDSLLREIGLPDTPHGKKCYSVSCGSDAPCPDCSALKAMVTGTIQFDRRQSDAGDKHWQITNIPLKNSCGEIFRVLRFAYDVSELKKTKIALAESEERWKFAIEGSQLGVWDWDVESGIEYHSPLWKTMLGFRQDEDLSWQKDWEALIHPDDFAETLSVVNDHLQGRTPHYQRVLRLRCREGTYKWIRSRGLVVARSADGAPLRAIGTHEDITAQKLMEIQSNENLSIFQTAFNSIPLGISIVNPDMTVRFINDFLKSSLSDVTPALGCNCYFIFAARQEPCDDCPVKRAFASNKKEKSIIQVQRSNVKKWVQINAIPIVDSASGMTKCVVEVVKDISKEYELGCIGL